MTKVIRTETGVRVITRGIQGLPGSGGGGAIDHGDLNGLGDDDHTQYHTDARGDARYYTKSQVDTSLSGKADSSHTHTASQITDFNIAADARITAQKAQNSGLATLDSGGKIPTSQLPALAVTSTSVVNSQAAQLALTAQEGDVAVRTDQNKSYIHNGGSAGSMADWQELLTPTDTVISVNGQTGAVTITTSHVSEGSNQYFTNARSIAATLTGFASGAGTVSATDSILAAIQKIVGNIAALVTGVSSVFGRTGAVTAQNGDYNTSQVTEGSNLYHTTNRARSAAVLNTLAGTETDQAPSVSSVNTALATKGSVNRTQAIIFNARADSTTSLTAMPAAEQFFPSNSKRAIVKRDLSEFTQCRLVANVATGATPSGKLVAKYKTSLTYATDVASDFSNLGTSEVSVSVTTAGVIVSSWINLATSAKADVFLCVAQINGDGTSTPGIGLTHIELR